MGLHRNGVALAVVLTLVSAPAIAQQAQPAQAPQEAAPGFKNLQVLPKDIDRRELMGYMRGFAMGLGVRCSFCHKGEGDDLSTYDFASDDKDHKAAARVMLQMVKSINNDHLSKLPHEAGEAPIKVMCATCHRGQSKPELPPPPPPPPPAPPKP